MDKTVSARALELRNRVLEMGFPCAVSFPPFSAEPLRPVICILTFQDAVDTIRRSPFDDIPVFACGKGFVNRLMNTELFGTAEEMLDRMEKCVFAYLQTEKALYFTLPGYQLSHGFIRTEQQVYYRFFPLKLTNQEKLILQLILMAPDHPHAYRRIEAYCFPYPYYEYVHDIANTITVQISSINKKAAETCGKKLLRYKAGGTAPGYILDIRNIEQPVQKKK